jgi:recombination protein RecA
VNDKTADAIDQARVSAIEQFMAGHNTAAVKSGTPAYFTENSKPLHVEVISTGSPALDVALGVGGLPRGRIVEVYGPEHSGKTSLALSVCAQAIKAGGVAGFIDAEHAINFEHAKWLGVNTDYFVLCQPDYGEQALQQVEAMCLSDSFDIIVVDSVSSLVPKAEMDGEIGDQFVGLQARMMSQALRRLQTVASNTNTTLLFINQLREKIGVMYGNPETTSGGRALKFYSSVRLDVRSAAGARIKEGKGDAERIIGQVCKVKIQKNKVAPPFRKAEYRLMYGTGIDMAENLVSSATTLGVWAMKPGGTFIQTDTEEVIGRGKDNVAQLLRDDPQMLEQVRVAVLETLTAARTYDAVTSPLTLDTTAGQPGESPAA